MSFVLVVDVTGLTWERAAAIAAACSQPGGFPIRPPRRPRFVGREGPPRLWIDDGDGLLSDDADWDAETWALERPLLPRLQATLRCLCETLPEGFTFFAGWIGDDIQERQVECAELLDYVGRSRLSPHTRYRVRAH